MKLLTDREYFRDCDEVGKTPAGKPEGRRVESAAAAFERQVEAERKRKLQLTVKVTHSRYTSSEYQDEERVKQARLEVWKLTQEAWQRCVAAVGCDTRDEIRVFPGTVYPLCSFKAGGQSVPMGIDARTQIEYHSCLRLERLEQQRGELKAECRDRLCLRLAAILAVVNLLLNLPVALGCFPGLEHLNPAAIGLGGFWWVIPTVVMALAVALHHCRVGNLLWDIFAVVVVFAVNLFIAPDPAALDSLERMICGGVLGLMCLIYAVYFLTDGIRAPKVQGLIDSYVRKTREDTRAIHKELRFLALWYRQMTGKTCPNLEKQEQTLRGCIDYCEKLLR